MIEIVRYTSNHETEWNNLISTARNSSFLFNRNYLEYHSDRFHDYSFVFYKNGKIEAVLPGNIQGDVYYSHQGLTYGGLVSTTKVYTSDIIEMFDLLGIELLKLGVKEVIYKPIPLIYHRIPSQEDIYVLFLKNSVKIACNISSTIYQDNRLKFTESRKSGLRKSIRENVKVEESDDLKSFWDILESNLISKYDRKPVHTLEEIELLHNRFPNNIKLYIAKHESNTIGGTLLYLNEKVVHVQYISASILGKELGALDLIFDTLINQVYSMTLVFDFGQSTEQAGRYLNQNLIFQKEGFGGRGIVYDIYKYSL